MSSLPYRMGVGIMLLNADKQVFVAKRIDTKAEAWQMPQGGIDAGEASEKAALRELQEETGVYSVRIIHVTDWLTYDLPEVLIPQLWHGKYRGQKQQWFIMDFLGDEQEINIAQPHPEFSEWKWIAPHQLPDVIVPFKRDLYARPVEEYARRAGS